MERSVPEPRPILALWGLTSTTSVDTFRYFWKVCNKPKRYFCPSSNINPPYCRVTGPKTNFSLKIKSPYCIVRSFSFLFDFVTSSTDLTFLFLVKLGVKYIFGVVGIPVVEVRFVTKFEPANAYWYNHYSTLWTVPQYLHIFDSCTFFNSLFQILYLKNLKDYNF
jgi:hypothetical protein